VVTGGADLTAAQTGENSIAWVDGGLLTIDQRALPRELRRLRITTVDGVIDAIKTLAIRGAPAIGVAAAFGVALAARTYGGDAEKVALEAARIGSARPTAVNLAWGVQRALARLPHGPQAVLEEALAMLDEDGCVNRAAATSNAPGGAGKTLLQVMADGHAADVRLRTRDPARIGAELAHARCSFRPLAHSARSSRGHPGQRDPGPLHRLRRRTQRRLPLSAHRRGPAAPRRRRPALGR
jgi:hypothetical protein